MVARSNHARDALIQSGIEVFGQQGYEGASNRELAEAAGVNQALIAYHFDGKEGLYLAVFEFMADRIGRQFETLAGEMEAAIEALEYANANPEDICIRYIEKLMERHVQIFFEPQMQSYAKLILREQLEPSKAFNVLYDGLMRRIMNLLTLLIARSIGRREPTDADKLSALMLMGQVLVFRAARATVTCHMDWKDEINQNQARQILARLRVFIRGMIGALREEIKSPEA
ncbi:MAG: CerR family C-terminal domain-containing protein [Granulosicoccus sp.]